jgi:hypothetical protein
LIRDVAKGTIGWLRGSGNSFAAYQTLCSVPARAFFDAGDLTGDAVKDLAVVLAEQGVLRVYNGAKLLRHATVQ